MDLKTRLRNLVNNEFTFYPAKGQANEESEVGNRYDSDEEVADSDSEEEEQLDLNGEIQKTGLTSQERKLVCGGDLKEELLEGLFEGCDTAQKLNSLNPSTLRKSIYLTSSDKKFKNKIQFEAGDFRDEEFLQMVEKFDFDLLDREISRINSENNFEGLDQIILIFENKFNFLDEADTLIFYANILNFFINKISFFIGGHKNSKNFDHLNNKFKENVEEKNIAPSKNFFANNSNSTNNNNFTIFSPLIAKITKIFISVFSKSKKILADENFKHLYERIFLYLISSSDTLLDLQINFNSSFKDSDLISNITKLIFSLSQTVKVTFNKDDLSSLPHIRGKLKSIVTNINYLFTNELYFFSMDEKKDLFNCSFSLLKENNFVNIYIPLVDLLCNILKSHSGQDFINKFIELLLIYFIEFADESNLKEEKFYIPDRRLITTYKNYFGVYKSFNGDTISLFTFLFLQFFSIIYSSAINENKSEDNKFFYQVFETLITKIFETKKNTLLLIFYCISVELLGLKYNNEFSVSLIVLTNIFLSCSNMITKSEVDLSARKLFMSIYGLIIDDILLDFGKIKELHLCLKDKDKDGGTSLAEITQNKLTLQHENCNCFSCSYVNRNILQPENHFKCANCLSSTNLNLQVIRPEDDTMTNICGFCNMKAYFADYDLFKTDFKFNLIDTKEDLLKELSKNKSPLKEENGNEIKKQKKENTLHPQNNSDEKLNNSEISEPTPPQELCEKFLYFQNSLYKNSSTFVQTNILNFLIIFNKNESSCFSQNIDLSFKIFLKILISDNKINMPLFKDFYQNVWALYNSQKGRIFNTLPSLYIEQSTINYFYFYYFYINLLFAGHWRLIDILVHSNGDNIHYLLRLKALKMLEKILIFEGEEKIFLNFHPAMLGVLLTDSSFNIKEYSLEILFKLFKFKKISKSDLVSILYEKVNEPSFLIRKRIVKALINLLQEEKEEDKDNFTLINFIFLNKLMDNSESLKIKNIIYDFYFNTFSKKSTHNSEGKSSSLGKVNLGCEIIKTFIYLMKDQDEQSSAYSNRNNVIFEEIKNLFNNLINEKKLKQSCVTNIADFIINNFILFDGVEILDENENGLKMVAEKAEKQEKAEKEENNNLQETSQNLIYYNPFLLQGLKMLKIISSFNSECVIVYFESLLELLNFNEKENQSSVNDNKIIYDNILKSLVCETFVNLLNQSDPTIKRKFIYTLENSLLKVMIYKPSYVMISAIECYAQILSREIVPYNKIIGLTSRNYYFLKDHLESITNQVNSGNSRKNKTQNDVPEHILYKSLFLLSYLAYSCGNEELIKIFSFSTENNIHNNGLSLTNQAVCEKIFYILKAMAIEHPKTSIKFRSFEALGYFWIRFPHKIYDSKEIILSILDKMSTDEDKLTVLRTFLIFFEKVIKRLSSTENNNSSNFLEGFDFGGIHLFFENFINKICSFLVVENNHVVRLQTINLIKLIVELGNINVHHVLPYVFASIFDWVDEIRFISTNILEKIIKISKEKFFTFMKDSLKQSFAFQQKVYVLPNFINSFVKKPTKDGNYQIQNENVFELLSYKISKTLKEESFTKRIINKFVQVFAEIKNMENDLTPAGILEKIDFYEFIAKLIADFKFVKCQEILVVFQFLWREHQTEFLVLQTKIKEYRDSQNLKIENKLLSNFCSVVMKTSIFKFLLAKYDNFDGNEDLLKVNPEDFISQLSKGEIELKANKNKKMNNNNKSDVPSISKELKNVKFYQFYQSSIVLIKKVFRLGVKKNFTATFKEEIISLMRSLKKFENMKTLEIRNSIAKYKKKKSSDAEEYLYSLLFLNESKKSEDSNHKNHKNSSATEKRELSSGRTEKSQEKSGSLKTGKQVKPRGGNKRISLEVIEDQPKNEKPISKFNVEEGEDKEHQLPKENKNKAKPSTHANVKEKKLKENNYKRRKPENK